jgi:hypothetical protein
VKWLPAREVSNATEYTRHGQEPLRSLQRGPQGSTAKVPRQQLLLEIAAFNGTERVEYLNMRNKQVFVELPLYGG